MPIDINLANWNKENENSSPLTSLPSRIHGVTSASAGARLTPKSCRIPLGRALNYSALASCASTQQFTTSTSSSANVTPRCRKFLKRVDFVTEEPLWTKIRQAFSGDEFLHKDDDQNIISELLTLCSWWSENENFAKGYNSGGSSENGDGDGNGSTSEDDDSIFSDLTNYLRSSSALRLAAAANCNHLQHNQHQMCRNESETKLSDFFGEETIVKKPFVHPSTMRLTQISTSEFDLNASF